MDLNQALIERAQHVIPGGVNSPVRAFGSVGGAPRFIERAKGPYMWDVTDKRFTDYVCSWGPMILGHNDPFDGHELPTLQRRACRPRQRICIEVHADRLHTRPRFRVLTNGRAFSTVYKPSGITFPDGFFFRLNT